MLVIVLQEVIVCNLTKIIFLNHLFHGEAENFLNYPRIYWQNSPIAPFNPFPHNDTFWRPWGKKAFWKHWEKEKLLVTSNFPFSHSVFYQFRELSPIYIEFKIVVCNLFQFGPVQIFCRLLMG